jgi:8-oxo-dGTP pyrophosphatase MutT (NUDIX family)
MNSLTDHQISALDRYEDLQTRHPELFRNRELRAIITDRAMIEAYALEHGVVVGVAAETPYFLFISDLVQPANGSSPFLFSRLIHCGQLEGGTNVAVLATIADPALGQLDDIVVVEQERHATGQMEIAIPRGLGAPDQNGFAKALSELEEETGYLGSDSVFLGESVIDSGAGDARVSFYHVRVRARVVAKPDPGESIQNVKLISPAALWEAIRSREVTDSFTVQALALAGYCQG